MKLRFEGISRNQIPRLRKMFGDYEFLFPDWVSDVTVGNESDQENVGSCSPSARYRRMNIYLSKAILSEPDDILCPIILHEIAHRLVDVQHPKASDHGPEFVAVLAGLLVVYTDLDARTVMRGAMELS